MVQPQPKLVKRWVQWGIVILLMGLGGFFLLRWLRPAALTAQRLYPLPQHPQIQVYLNHNPTASYRDPYRAVTRPGDNLEQVIIEAIQQARQSIEVAIQELRSPLIAQALRDRHQAGVRVRLVLENTYSRPWSSFSAAEVAQLTARLQDRYRDNVALIDQNQDGQLSATEINTRDALAIVQQARIPWLDDTADGSVGSGLMHHKFVVVDGQQVVVTSANFTLSDLHGDLDQPQSLGNANSLVRIESRAIAQLFQTEFDILWGDGPGGATDSRFGVQKPFRTLERVSVGQATVGVKFSPSPAPIPWPQRSNGVIAQALSRSRRQVDLALFVFSEQRIADQLQEQAQQGVQVRTLIEPTFAYQYYSEGLDLLGVALPNRSQTACQFEAQNQPWNKPIQSVGITQLNPGDLLHHKFGIVDRRWVIMGSHNWSEAADRLNDETILILDSPVVAAHYDREFNQLWGRSRLGLPQRVRDQVQAAAKTCTANEANPANPDPRLNLNTASAAELETLPGIGPVLAQEIIQARQQQQFQSLADLDRVPGIGPKILAKLRDRVRW